MSILFLAGAIVAAIKGEGDLMTDNVMIAWALFSIADASWLKVLIGW